MMKNKFRGMVLALAAAGAVAASPFAFAATAEASSTLPLGSTITQRPGHVAIDATPDQVSPARSYGPFSSPWFILGD